MRSNNSSFPGYSSRSCSRELLCIRDRSCLPTSQPLAKWQRKSHKNTEAVSPNSTTSYLPPLPIYRQQYSLLRRKSCGSRWCAASARRAGPLVLNTAAVTKEAQSKLSTFCAMRAGGGGGGGESLPLSLANLSLYPDRAPTTQTSELASRRRTAQHAQTAEGRAGRAASSRSPAFL